MVLRRFKTNGYYDGQNPWDYPAVDYGDGFEFNTVAFGKAKGKGKAKGYQGKGYQPFNTKGQAGVQEKGNGEGGQSKGGESGSSSFLKEKAAGLIVFTGTCYERGAVGHTWKYCYARNPSVGCNSTCSSCGVWGTNPTYARKQ